MAYSPDVMAKARARTREVLAQSTTFSQLPSHEQVKLYGELLDANAKQLSSGGSFALAQAKKGEPQKGSDLIDDSRHRNTNIEKAAGMAGDFVESVNFPQFVRDLLKAVFDANLSVTIQQMEAYQKLLKSATASLSKFVTAIDDTAAFGYLAENNDEFSFDFADEDKNEDGTLKDGAKAQLMDKSGNKLDLGDNEVKAKIMDAKIAMAREQRALLRETILMGVSRLVVERGTIKAGVTFDIKASEKIDRADKAAVKKENATSATATATGPFGNFFGGVSGGTTHTSRSSQISISTTKSTASTDLSAKLQGSVEIVFKSDYFKLDNFATMYGGLNEGGAAPGKPAQGGPAAPPALPSK